MKRLLKTTILTIAIMAGLSYLGSSPVGAQGNPKGGVPGKFDHQKTSFPLTGQHKTLPCESCHVGGQYEKLSSDCSVCHRLPKMHIVNQVAAMKMGGCIACHSTADWQNTTFVHTPEMTAGMCQRCHDGKKARGKPSRHIPTTTSCEVCHRPGGWKPASFTHDATTVGKCSTCHTKPSGHVATTAQCDTCHKSTTTFTGATFTHDATTVGKCSTCHTKPTGHVATTAQCDTCHKSTTTFTGATFTHDATTVGKCSTCHTKPSGHVATTAQCDTCHKSTTTFTGASYTHDATSVGKCSTCHTKPSGHLTTTRECDTCHRTTGWIPVAYTSHNNPKLIGGHTGLECKTCHVSSLDTAFYRDGVQYGFCSNCHRRDYKYPGPDEHRNAGATFNASLQKNANCANCHEHATYRFGD